MPILCIPLVLSDGSLWPTQAMPSINSLSSWRNDVAYRSAISGWAIWSAKFISRVLAVQGFDHELVGAVSDAVSIPVIASSGAGKPAHFTEVCAG
jgi:hypothetical protein